MKKKTIIIIMSLIIISLSSIYTYSIQNKVSNNTQTTEQEYRKEFDSFTLKSNFKSRDEVAAEAIRLEKAYKHALGTHGNDEYSKEANKKFETMLKQLQNKFSEFPAPLPDLDKEIEGRYEFLNDSLAREDSSISPDEYNNAKYAFDEAHSIYDQYKNKTITTQQAYDRIMKVKYTDRQKGIKN